MSKVHRKIRKILPGDLVCDQDPCIHGGISALVVSVSNGSDKERDVYFLILGDSYLHDGVTDKDTYYLVSRLDLSTFRDQLSQ